MMNGTGKRAQHRVELEQVLGVEMQHDVPAERGGARDEPLELAHVRRAAQVLHEIEAHAANAAGVQLLEVAVREAVVDVRDAAVRPPLCAIASTITVLSTPWQLALTSTARERPSVFCSSTKRSSGASGGV